MNEEELRSLCWSEIQDSIAYSSGELSSQREKALKYYLGEPFGNEIEGRSKVVLTDVADTIEWMLPSLLKVFASGDQAVRFEPVGPEDEEAAQQATDYVNWIFHKDNPGFLILYTWFKDALLQKNGFVKRWWEVTERCEQETYENLSDEQYQALLTDEAVEIIAHTPETETEEQQQVVLDPMTGQPTPIAVPVEVTKHAVTLKRYVARKGRVRIENVPPEEALISRRAKSIADTPFFAHKVRYTATDLVEMGFDRKLVDELPGDDDDLENQERLARFAHDDTDRILDSRDDAAMRLITVYECYIRADYDDDGKAELRKVTVAGKKVLDNEVVDSIPFSAITPVILPHKFFGLSIADLVMDLQLIRSTIMRQVLDNMYLTNTPRIEVPEDAVNENTYDDLVNHEPGAPIRTKIGGQLNPIVIPPVWQHGVGLIEFITAERESRTGVTRYNQGLDANTLNKTATGISQIFNAAQQRMELVARIFAETGVKDLFRAILEDVSKHQNEKRTIRLRNKWVEIDPTGWNHRMDLSVNVGLGTGNKDQQLAHHMAILQEQKGLMAANVGLVGPKQLYNTLGKITEAAGLQTVEPYFTNPEETEPPQPAPDPAMEKIKLEAEKAKADVQLKMKDLEIKAVELEVEKARLQFEIEKFRQEASMKAQEMEVAHFERGANLALSGAGG